MPALSTAPWLAFDFETTGTDPSTAEIIQVGTALREANGSIRSGAAWCNPQPRDLATTEAVRRHLGADLIRAIKLSDGEMADIAGSCSASSRLANLSLGWTKRPVVLGWNTGTRLGQPYDCQILARSAERFTIPFVDRAVIDLMPVVAQTCDTANLRLSEGVAEYFGIRIDNAHRADGDCRTTLDVMAALLERGLVPDDVEMVAARAPVRWVCDQLREAERAGLARTGGRPW